MARGLGKLFSDNVEPGVNPFSILRSPDQASGAPNLFFSKAEDQQPASSIFEIFRPAGSRSSDLVPSHSVSAGGDPFSAAPTASRRKEFKGRPGGPGGEAWRPYPRMREGYAMSGLGCDACSGSSILENPALWLIAGVGLLVTLEATGVTKLSSNA